MELVVGDDWELLSGDAFQEDQRPPTPPLPVFTAADTYKFIHMDMNYFLCPSSSTPPPPPPPPPSSPSYFHPPGPGGRLLLPFPIDDQFEMKAKKKAPPDHPDGSSSISSISSKQIIPKLPLAVEITHSRSSVPDPTIGEEEAGDDQDPVSHLFFFNKMKETQFVDIKVESPKSPSSPLLLLPPKISEGVAPPLPAPFLGDHQAQVDVVMQFEEGQQQDHQVVVVVDPPTSPGEEHPVAPTISTSRGFNSLWRWGFGVAATAVCILIFRPQHRPNKHQLRIHFYTHHNQAQGGGGMKPLVQQAATMNGAISAAVAGVPLFRGAAAATSAHITFGGYHDAL